jgi:hypothetical protein
MGVTQAIAERRLRTGHSVLAPATVLRVQARASPPQRPYLRLTQTLTIRVEPFDRPGCETKLTVVSTRREDDRGLRDLHPLPELRVGQGPPPVIVVLFDPSHPSRVKLVIGPEARRIRTEHAMRGAGPPPDADSEVADDIAEELVGSTVAARGSDRRRPAPDAPDPAKQLRALATLRDRGIVSEAEFAARASRLQGRG